MAKNKNMTRKELLNLPRRKWNEVSDYNAILIVPDYSIHDSGYRLMAIIGCDEHWNPKEIAAYCDDINWISQEKTKPLFGVRTDMFTNNIIRFHSNYVKFRVGISLSTTDIIIKNNDKIL